jgi:tetratricopeptide (TPR) repeat protein
MPRESPIARIERLFDAGDNAGALLLAEEFLRQSPNSFLARFARARAFLRLGKFIDAETDMEMALRLSPNDEHARLVRANMDLRLGKLERAIELLRPIAHGRGPQSVEAKINLLMVYFRSGRHDEFAEEVAMEGAWRKDPRALLMQARATAQRDREAGIGELTDIFRSKQHPALRRSAGFEAVGLLDKAGRYREAFDLATEIHRATTGALDVEEWTGPMRMQIGQLQKGPGFFKPRADPVQGVAFVVAMPRSGTTLLEQMLDRHPLVSGIGEFDGLDVVGRSLFDGGPWPRVPSAVPDARFRDLQKYYLEGAKQIRREGATWTFDKSLRTWRMLPEVLAVLPGSVFINVDRDPRDVATSIFLSYFNPTSYEWTQSLDAIRQVVELQRQTVPLAFEVLGLPNVSIVYEDLVEDPASYAAQCLKLMGLGMDERVLSPEQNKKGAYTLSFAQVRQPINRRSVARWKNYEFAFDSSWDKVVAAHDARRVHR